MVRKINARLVLRLRSEGLSFAQIETQGVSRHSVIKVERAAARESLTWATAAGMTDREVYERLFPGVCVRESGYVQPDWDEVHGELGKVGVTLKLLHAEYLDTCAAAGWRCGHGIRPVLQKLCPASANARRDFPGRSQGWADDRGRLVRAHDATHRPRYR